MADAMRGACSMTPVVTNVGIGNSADVDVLHDDIKATLGGKMTVDATAKYFSVATEANNVGPKWYYCPDLIIDTTPTYFYNSYAVSGGIWNGNDTTQTTTLAARFTTYDVFANSIAGDDHIRMIYIENTGLDKTGAATTNVLVYNDGSDATPFGSGTVATKYLEPGESVIIKYVWNTLWAAAVVHSDAACEADHLFFTTIGASGAVAAAPDNVCAKIVAFVEDGV